MPPVGAQKLESLTLLSLRFPSESFSSFRSRAACCTENRLHRKPPTRGAGFVELVRIVMRKLLCADEQRLSLVACCIWETSCIQAAAMPYLPDSGF